uniref:LRRNT domain-containing protein n=1 Tax=Neogobius melanostomus TaxID=47308 RepID=A0A8C6SIT8_9GOBI
YDFLLRCFCRLVLAALYLLGAGVALSSEIQCPLPCFCNASEQSVNCSGVQLSSIPNNLPVNAKSVRFTHNKVKSLGSHQFQGLAHLQELDLCDNILAVIEVEAFVGLQTLLSLKLARNHLKIIPVEAFSGLPKLQLLDISDNEILVLLAFTFRDLPSLRCLNVPTNAITQFSEVKSLHFNHFGLATLPNFSFYPLGSLKQLVISHWVMLETISVNSLFGLNLTHLTITNCNLSAVPYTPLHHLVYLAFCHSSARSACVSFSCFSGVKVKGE